MYLFLILVNILVDKCNIMMGFLAKNVILQIVRFVILIIVLNALILNNMLTILHKIAIIVIICFLTVMNAQILNVWIANKIILLKMGHVSSVIY